MQHTHNDPNRGSPYETSKLYFEHIHMHCGVTHWQQVLKRNTDLFLVGHQLISHSLDGIVLLSECSSTL